MEANMEGWNLEQVKVLSEQYVAAGLGDSSSGRFLSSLVTSKKPPRGNGVSWLNDLLKKGNPAQFKVLLTEVHDLAAVCPTLALEPLTRALHRGDNLTDWQNERLETARAQAQEPHIELTDEERRIAAELNTMKNARSTFYWSGRPAIHARLNIIFDRILRDLPIRRSDLDFAFEQFGPAVRELREPRHKIGDLVRGPGNKIGMVVSAPFARSVIHYEVLVDGNKVDLPTDSLLKRIKV